MSDFIKYKKYITSFIIFVAIRRILRRNRVGLQLQCDGPTVKRDEKREDGTFETLEISPFIREILLIYPCTFLVFSILSLSVQG